MFLISLLALLVTYHVVCSLRERFRVEKLLINIEPIPPQLYVYNKRNIFKIPSIYELLKVACACRKVMGGIFKLQGLRRPAILLCETETISKIIPMFKEENESVNMVTGELFGNGNITGDNPIAVPALRFGYIKKYYLEIFNRHYSDLIDEMRKNELIGKTINVQKTADVTNLLLSWEIFAGPGNDANRKEIFLKFSEIIIKAMKLLQMKIMFHHMGLGTLYRIYLFISGKQKIIGKSEQLLKQFTKSNRDAQLNRKDVDTNSANGDDFKSLLELLQDAHERNKHYTKQDMLGDIKQFWLAGSETISITIKITLLLLAIHPDIQKKVHNELRKIFEHSDEQPTEEDLSKMNFLEQCVKETWRLFPPAPAISRQDKQDIYVSDGVVIPAKTPVFALIYVAHRDESIYPEPDTYDPNRFAPEEIAKRPAHSFMPFGWKPRNWIGDNYAMLACKTALAILLRTYRVSTQMTMEDIDFNISPTIQLFRNDFQIHPI